MALQRAHHRAFYFTALAWRLAKPVAEMWPTPIWGFVVAEVTLRIGSVWYIFLGPTGCTTFFMDTTILMNRGIFWARGSLRTPPISSV